MSKMQPLAHVCVKDAAFNVYLSICMTSFRVHVFRYSEDRVCCDYAVCETEQEATEYLRSPFPHLNIK